MHQLDTSRSIDADEQRMKQMNQLVISQVSDDDLYHFTRDDLLFLTQQQKTQNDLVIKLSSALVIERERIKQLNEIQKQIAECLARIDEINAQNETRSLASELVSGKVNHHG